jgi:hypothetical protein
MQRDAAARPVHLTLSSPTEIAQAAAAFARQVRALKRTRKALRDWKVDPAPVDAAIAEVERLHRAVAPQAELALDRAERPAAPAPLPDPAPPPPPRARGVGRVPRPDRAQLDWTTQLEARQDDLAEYFHPTR